MNRTERLLDLITYLLNAREPVSWQEIKNHFSDDYARGVEESNQRKFERDKAELISLGIPIDYRAGANIKKEGYLIDKEKLFLPEISFDPQEFSLLMLSANAVLRSPDFPYRGQLESALHKITRLHQPGMAAPAEIGISYSGKPRTGRSDWIQKLQNALERRKTVEIEYHAFSTGETTRRKVDPYGLVFRKGSWTLIGWDHLRRDLRSFVLTRMRELKVNERRPGTSDYEIPKDFSLRKYQNQQPWELELHSPVEVTVEVSRHRLLELLPQLASAEAAGERRFRLRVTHRPGFIAWLLSQKTDVQVLEPAEMQEEIRQVLEKFR